mgnify:CR=1 FL=1
MLTLFRWLLRLTIALIVVLVLAVVLAWYFFVRSLPDYDATLTVSGISAPVEIVRSTEDVPNIFGQTDEDVFFALGLAHAQDRLFQMTLLRRAAQGRLSEVYGAGAFAADDLARRLEIYRSAAASLEAQDEATRSALEAYAAGVNQWIAKVNDGALGRGAPEFFLVPQDIAYWQPADSLAILKLLAAATTDAAAEEILRARLSLADPDRGPEVLTGEAEPRALPRYRDLFPGLAMPAPEKLSQPAGLRDVAGFLRPGAGLGGNGFAAASGRTAAGGALLANDLDIPLIAPSLYYLARLQLTSGGVIVFNGWAARDNPWFSLPLSIAERNLGPLPSPPLGETPPPGPLAFADVTYVTGLLRQAGYRQVEGWQETIAIRHPGGLDALMQTLAYVGPISTLYRLKQPGAAQKAHIAGEIREAFSAFVDAGGGIDMPGTMAFYRAVAP